MERLSDVAPCRWGIVGTGGIAAKFAADLRHVAGATITAVATTNPDRATGFVEEHGVRHVFSTPAELGACDDVDLVYVANPHAFHERSALPVIEAGTGVLVEKSFSLNEPSARRIFEAARAARVPALEAMWTAYLPQTTWIAEQIEAGAIGEVTGLRAVHNQDLPTDKPRLWRPELGGGALLDLGVYNLSFAQFTLGNPTELTATAEFTDLGVDLATTVAATYPGGARADLECRADRAEPAVATITGTGGRIELADRYYNVTEVTVHGAGNRTLTRDFRPEAPGGGFEYQIAEAARVRAARELESPQRPWAATLGVMAAMDAVRHQIGLTYPGPRAPGE